jgi:hypothetical protein
VLERVSLSEPQNSIVPAPIILPARRTADVLVSLREASPLDLSQPSYSPTAPDWPLQHDNGNEPAVPLFVSLSDEVCRACQQQPEVSDALCCL